VRRLLRTRPIPPAQAAPRRGRLSGRWLAALLVTGVLALLVPSVSFATASQSRPATATAATAATADVAVGCRGVTPAVFPAAGFITNPSRSQAGHLWWRPSTGGICIGTVIEWVQYNTTATKTWRVIVYSAQHPNGQIVAQRTFTLGPGWYWWSFGVHQVFSGQSAVCITADDSFGAPCLHFGPSSG
jgi:hypothetical protein